MGVTLYRSTDASAPSLAGQVGSLIGVLDACLVNGYGSQPAAGWTKAFTGTNKASYRQGSGSNGFYLDVNDAAPDSAAEARMTGYETMTAVGTGTQAFPTSSQQSFAIPCRKSVSADATARKWYVVADATCVYIFVETLDYTVGSSGFMFGDIFAYKSPDPYATMILGRGAANNGSYTYEYFQALNNNAAAWLQGTLGNHYIDRSWNGVGGSLPVGKHTALGAYGTQNNMGFGNVTYPNGPDNAIQMAPVYVHHNGSIRGYMKGLWCTMHNFPLGHGDTFNGSGNLAGKSFIALNILFNTGQIILETSNTWS